MRRAARDDEGRREMVSGSTRRSPVAARRGRGGSLALRVLDGLMERASRALVQTQYFDAERLARAALEHACRRGDYERMARILMPLQEARRQKRQLAVDEQRVQVLRALPGAVPRAGCVLVEPPLVALHARRLRERADRARVPLFVLAREPLTRAGRCPVAAVGARRNASGPFPLVVRTLVAPPGPAPTVAWFEAAAEALGDAAIASVPADLHPAWRVDDLLERLDAVPEHEKLHQRLQEACRDAVSAPPPPPFRARESADPFF